MTYWYHTATGYTVVAKKNSNTEELNKKLPQELSTNFQGIWIDLALPEEIPNIAFSKSVYSEYGTTYEGIYFYFNVPNPKFYNINFSQLYYIKSENKNEELTIETADEMHCIADTMSETFDEVLAKNNNPYFEVTHAHWYKKSENKRDAFVKFRILYKYEENGEVKYFYYDEIGTTCNQLISEGKTQIVEK